MIDTILTKEGSQPAGAEYLCLALSAVGPKFDRTVSLKKDVHCRGAAAFI